MKHKITTAEHDPAALKQLQELVRSIDIAMVTTVRPDGALHSRPMTTRDFTADGEVCFLTTDESGMASDLEAEHAVNLSYADPKHHRYVSVTGNATVRHDRERAKALWHPTLKVWFPQGLDDPHLAVMRVRVETAEFWDASAGKMTRLLGNKPRGIDTNDPETHTEVAIRATAASG